MGKVGFDDVKVMGQLSAYGLPEFCPWSFTLNTIIASPGYEARNCYVMFTYYLRSDYLKASDRFIIGFV